MPAPNMPQMMPPPTAPIPGQLNGLQRPVSAPPPPMVPGSAGIPTSSGAPPMFAPTAYQGNIMTPTTAGGESSNTTSAPAPETNQ